MKRNTHPTSRAYLISAIALALALSACTNVRPLKGGNAWTLPGASGSVQQTLRQGDNPDQPSHQDQEVIKLRTYTLPAGSRIEQPASADTLNIQGSNLPAISMVLTAPMPVIEREEVRANTQLGASQKDTTRELGAKLSSLRPITWIGVGLFLLGLASMAWPPLRAAVGSVTTSVAIVLGGLALVVLPTLVVGNEPLILGAVGLVGGAWFLAHRHGTLRGQLSAYSELADPKLNPPTTDNQPATPNR